mgnify:CR=1 FL=1
MGRVSDYLLQAARADATLPVYVPIDPRGPGHAIFSPFYVCAALARISLGAWRKEAALAHVNVGDHGSLWRNQPEADRLPGTALHEAVQIVAAKGTPRAIRKRQYEVQIKGRCDRCA